jgi:hypothetical protein
MLYHLAVSHFCCFTCYATYCYSQQTLSPASFRTPNTHCHYFFLINKSWLQLPLSPAQHHQQKWHRFGSCWNAFAQAVSPTLIRSTTP